MGRRTGRVGSKAVRPPSLSRPSNLHGQSWLAVGRDPAPVSRPAPVWASGCQRPALSDGRPTGKRKIQSNPTPSRQPPSQSPRRQPSDKQRPSATRELLVQQKQPARQSGRSRAHELPKPSETRGRCASQPASEGLLHCSPVLYLSRNIVAGPNQSDPVSPRSLSLPLSLCRFTTHDPHRPAASPSLSRWPPRPLHCWRDNTSASLSHLTIRYRTAHCVKPLHAA